MKAMMYTGAHQLEMQDIPHPEPGPGQVVVDLDYCGICGSDMHAYHGLDPRRVPPLVLGHEAVGVAQDGALKGKRVAVNPLETCGTCGFCTGGQEHLCAERALIGLKNHGAYAEAVAIGEGNLSVLPDDLDLETAALAEPLAVCVHAAEIASAWSGREIGSVAVLGGGAIGILSGLVYRPRAETLWVAEPNPNRRATVEKSLDAKAYDPASGGPAEGTVDLVVDAVGSGRTRAAASALVRPGGTILHIGLQDSAEGLDTRRITLQEIAFVGTYCYTKQDFAEALRLLHERKVTGEGWTEIRPLDAGPQSFRDVDDGTAPPKIILACA